MNNKKEIIKAIILAGGYSKRMKLNVPKQLAGIGNRPILSYALDAFEKCKDVDGIILVAHKKILRQCRNLARKYKKIGEICLGGETRQQSVFNALQKIKNCDYVLIHDGVRPFITQEIILKTIEAVKKFGAVTCAVRATDTIVQAKENFIGTTLQRDKLWHIQTPQAFRFDLILKAHQKARRKGIFNATDDAQLLFKEKRRIKLIAGSYRNIKITTISDLQLCRR